MHPEGFHAHSGWFFARTDDGGVRITHDEEGWIGEPLTVVLDANTWASVVASVSAAGETAETFTAAFAAHGAS